MLVAAARTDPAQHPTDERYTYEMMKDEDPSTLLWRGNGMRLPECWRRTRRSESISPAGNLAHRRADYRSLRREWAAGAQLERAP
jgi:hypothetical protein